MRAVAEAGPLALLLTQYLTGEAIQAHGTVENAVAAFRADVGEEAAREARETLDVLVDIDSLDLVELFIELETQGVRIADDEVDWWFSLLPTVRRLLTGDEDDDSEGGSVVREPRRPRPTGPLVDTQVVTDSERAGSDRG